MRSTERPTESRTGPSQQLQVFELTVDAHKGKATLVASRWVSGTVRMTRSWVVSPELLTAGLLDEIGSVVADLALTGLVTAIGSQGQLPFEVGQAFPPA